MRCLGKLLRVLVVGAVVPGMTLWGMDALYSSPLPMLCKFTTHLPPNPKRQNPVKELNLLNQPF